MDDFKSFEDFREGLHAGGGAEPNPPEEKPARKKSGGFHRFSLPAMRGWKTGLACGLGVLAAVALAIRFLPIGFGEIRLSGNKTMTMEDVLFDGEIESPVNVWQVDEKKLADRLAMDLRVESVTIERKFPFYIDVTLYERQPAAIVREEFGYAILDGDGMVLRTEASLRGADLPVITGLSLENSLLGDVVRKPLVGLALEFLNGLSEEVRNSFSEVNVGNAENIMAYTRDGVPVRLGKGDRMTERAVLAERMLTDMRTRKLSVEYIDASLTSPFFKMKI